MQKVGMTMKKLMNVKTILALLLSMVMLLSLCACEEKAPETENTTTTASTEASTQASSTTTTTKALPGSSKATTTTTKPTTTTVAPKTSAQLIVGKWRGSANMAPMLVAQGYNVSGEQLVSCDIEFTTNGVLYEVIDRTSLQTVYANVFTQVLDSEMKKNNLTKEQFETAIGMTYDNYITQLVQAAMDMVPKTIINAYEFRGNDLYVRDQDSDDFEKQTYSFSNNNNKLTIVEDGTDITYTRIG